MRRLLLVRHAPSSATRRAAFPDDEPVDADGSEQASRLADRLPSPCDAFTSPRLRCRQTSSLAGLDAQVEPRIIECDFGYWAGRTLAEVHDAAPAAAEQWMTDPYARPHGGESLTDFADRVAGWLDDAAASASASDCTVAITHGGVVKAAVVHAIGAPIMAFWRIAVAPLSLTELRAHDHRWTVEHLNLPADGSGGAP